MLVLWAETIKIDINNENIIFKYKNHKFKKHNKKYMLEGYKNWFPKLLNEFSNDNKNNQLLFFIYGNKNVIFENNNVAYMKAVNGQTLERCLKENIL